MPNLQKRQSSAKSDVMTPERLRKHLFGGPQVPFWNYDPKQLTFGVEVEYFIAHTHADGSFTLATKAEYLAVIEHLKSDFAYQDRKLHDQPGRVSRDTERGFIAIKPDFAWHILEISFPPRGDLEDLRQLMEKVFFEVDTALRKVGLERLDRSSLPDVPEKMELVELDRLGEISKTFNSDSEIPTAIPSFPALITATHVHLNILNEESYRLLANLYLGDEIVTRHFTRPTVFRGKAYQYLRAHLYRNTLGSSYHLCDVPSRIPSSLEDLCDLMNASSRLFPKDRFYPVRDMTNIRGTKYGTFEFRSSCSFREIDTLLDIVQCRIAQALFASHLPAPTVTDAKISKIVREIWSRIFLQKSTL